MAQPPAPVPGPLDRVAEPQQIRDGVRRNLLPQVGGVQIQVPVAAKGHVAAHRANAGHLHALVAAAHERRNAVEGNRGHPPALPLRARGHHARRGFQPHLVAPRQPAAGQQRGNHANGAVPAHVVVTDLAAEDHAHVGYPRRHHVGGVHRLVAARLAAQQGAQRVVVGARRGALRGHGVAVKGGQAIHHHPRGVAAGMSLDGRQHAAIVRRPAGRGNTPAAGRAARAVIVRPRPRARTSPVAAAAAPGRSGRRPRRTPPVRSTTRCGNCRWRRATRRPAEPPSRRPGR